MVTFAIPDFRMDKAGFDFEAMQLEKMGVKFEFNKALGKDFTIEKIAKQYSSVIVAIGMNKAKTLDLIENNVPAEKRIDALTFLKSFNQKENKIKEDSVILIIGGGNSAIDAARSAKKLNSKHRIIVSCIETESKIPAFAEEVTHAIEEGIEFICNSYAENVSVKNSEKISIKLYSFSDKKYLQDIQCDYVVTAIGQTTDPTEIGSLPKDENARVNGSTGHKNVFVAGDICSGNNLSVIGAIASGKKAAVRVRELLENYKFEYEGERALEKLNSNLNPVINLRSTKIDADINLEIEKYNLFQSCYKCNHCIDNFGCPAMVKINGKVQIDASRCNLCGLCIDVCPNNAIRWEIGTETVIC